jgi:hypothetical protein
MGTEKNDNKDCSLYLRLIMGSEIYRLRPVNGPSSKLVATPALRDASNIEKTKRE